MPKKLGFTLIELLVVVSIIAILMTIGMASYATVLENSRDAKRKADLKFIQSALEQYHADQKYYPLPASDASCPTTNNGKLTIGCPLKSPGTSNNKVYMNTVPKDPISTTATQYVYHPLPASSCNNTTVPCTSYCLFAKMDNPDNAISIPGCSYPSTLNYAVTPP